jgi:outer membrane protein OmpA-like peptidoglycan-associated protein/flagellar hook assembly protein FlgD
MKKRYFLLALLLASTCAPVLAEYNPPSGTELYYDLYSPVFLAGGDNSDSFESPAADALNPAMSALRQRVTLDLSYLGIIGSSTQSGYGQAINLGLTLPRPYGVFSTSAHLVVTPYSNPDTGTLFALNGAFSKDLYPNLLIGLGLSGAIGTNGAFDWALGADLGFLHLAGDVGFMKNFQWGIAMRGLGKGFSPVANRTSYPPNFTPAVGLSFDLLRTENLGLGIRTDLSFPTFQNIRGNIGADFSISDFFTLRASFPMDLHEWLAGNLRLPAFGLSFRFRTNIKKGVEFLSISERGWNRSEINVHMGAAPLPDGQWVVAGGLNIPLGAIDRNAPDISLGKAEDYISPNLDGVQDSLNFSLDIQDERYVMGYRLLVSDDQGQVVREIRNKDERPENEGIKNVIDRLLYVREGIGIPDSLRWDGRRDDGTMAADGVYSYVVEAWDDNGNVGRTTPVELVLDNTQPTVSIVQPVQQNLIFSPNNDGNKDTLTIQQSGSSEDAWKGVIQDSGANTVATFTWDNAAPQTFQWDGKNVEGVLVADGVYSYKVSTTDKAGNTVSSELKNIVVNTQATPVKIGIDKSIFSPNRDGKKDTVALRLDVPITSGISSWKVEIKNAADAAVYAFSGTDDLPSAVIFDGRNLDGNIIPEGSYKARLELMYINGNNPTAESPLFSVDLTPPSARITTEYNLFSPNGDGNRDVIPVYQETSEEETWYGRITDQEGKLVKEVVWQGRADSRVIWDGLDAEGRLAPDGSYTYRLSAEDKAGNSTTSSPISFTLDTEETSAILSAEFTEFSPNADGVKDKISLRPQLRIKTGIENYELIVRDASAKEVRAYRGNGAPPESIVWDGVDAGGRRVSDGEYWAELIVEYQKGDVPTARSNPFQIDTVYPRATVSSDFTLFSPDGDGQRDEITITQSSSSESIWNASIFNRQGTAVRKYFWKGEVENIRWDGKDDNGNIVPDGVYNYILTSADPAGNASKAALDNIRVDARPTPIFITVSSDGISPNGDGYREELTFNVFVNIAEGIRSWALAIVDSSGAARKTFTGKTVPNTIAWAGEADSGDIVEGIFQGVFQVQYEKGNQPQSATSRFVVDVSAPEVTLTTKPTPFSPDNDGVDDELSIELSVKDLSKIEEWEMVISDPRAHDFTTLSGVGQPAAKIIWDGRSDWGELVQSAEDYELTFTIEDILRNRASLTRAIPVDVLVIREGDRLKIRIANITFAPNSPDLVSGDPDAAERNMKTLARLAEILNKYKTYEIIIEGHANNLSWADAEKAKQEEEEVLQPLSLARAETVKAALGKLGVDTSRISTAGLGGTQPIVPFSDLDNRWKNRRVEFVLIK